MAKKRPRKITPEERARFDRFTREIDARIAERRARERANEGQSPSSR
jgi:putative hemolysin